MRHLLNLLPKGRRKSTQTKHFWTPFSSLWKRYVDEPDARIDQSWLCILTIWILTGPREQEDGPTHKNDEAHRGYQQGAGRPNYNCSSQWSGYFQIQWNFYSQFLTSFC